MSDNEVTVAKTQVTLAEALQTIRLVAKVEEGNED